MTRSNRSRLGIESFEDRLVPSSVAAPDVFLPIAVPVVFAGHGSPTNTGPTAADEAPTPVVAAAALNGLIDQARSQIEAEVATQVVVTVTVPSLHTSQGADTSSGPRPSVDTVAVNRDFSAAEGPEGTAVATATSYSHDSLSTEIVSMLPHPDDANNPTSPPPAVNVPGPTEQAITEALAMHASTEERATVFTPTGVSDPPSNNPSDLGPRADWLADLAARLTPISIGDRADDSANPAPLDGSLSQTDDSATPPPPDVFFAGLAALPPPEWLMVGINHGPNVDPNAWATQDVFRAANSRIVLANPWGLTVPVSVKSPDTTDSIVSATTMDVLPHPGASTPSLGGLILPQDAASPVPLFSLGADRPSDTTPSSVKATDERSAPSLSTPPIPDITTALTSALTWVAPALPAGLVVAGAVGLDVERLEQEADRLLAHVADLAVGLSDVTDSSSEYRWLALAAILSAGVGYTVWASRPDRRHVRLPGGPGSVLAWRGEEGEERGNRTR